MFEVNSNVFVNAAQTNSATIGFTGSTAAMQKGATASSIKFSGLAGTDEFQIDNASGLITRQGLNFSGSANLATTVDTSLTRIGVNQLRLGRADGSAKTGDLSLRGILSYGTNYYATLNTAGFTNSSVAPGIGGTNNMFCRITSTSGTLEYYHRTGVDGTTVCGVGVYTNTLTTTSIVIPVGVNCGFIIRSPVGVDLQAFAE